MNIGELKIVNKSNNPLPQYETENSAGMDLRAWMGYEESINDHIYLRPGERRLIHTGLYMAIPKGYEGQIRPRSGLALKKGITVLNTPGTIDADYRGEVGVILVNLSQDIFEIANGDRIAQIVFSKCEQLKPVSVDSLDETERGEGGFGHTGIK